MVRRLRPFEVRLIGIKRTHTEKARDELGLDWVGMPNDLPELLRRSDVVFLCLPVTPESIHLMGEKNFSYMKADGYLINLSRGVLVDRGALLSALSSRRIAGAGLDVFWEEPPDPEDPIFTYNVLATPHIAGSTDVSMSGIVSAVVENIKRVERSQEPLYLK